MRRALGASGRRLARQFLIEAALLVSAASATALAGAAWAMRALPLLLPADTLEFAPYLRDATVNGRVLTCAALVSVAVLVLFVVTPLVRARRHADGMALVEGARGVAGRTWGRLGSRFVMVELAVAVVLLASAGLLGRSAYRLLHVDLAFQPDASDASAGDPAKPRYATNPQQVVAGRELLARASRIPA